MTVKQVAAIVNDVQQQIVGEKAIKTVDLTGLIDMGKQILDATSYDNYIKTLVDHIGKVVFVNRPYKGSAPSVLMDGWEYGAILEKISSDMPNATENKSWELTDGATYDPNVFHKPQAETKFFSSRVTFEIENSITERQVKSAFSSAAQMMGFINMIFNEVDKSFTVKLDGLIMQTINNMTAETMHNAMPAGDYNIAGNARAVNLLYLYNSKFTKSLTVEQSIFDKEFLRFAAYIMGLYEIRMRSMSKLFNIGGKARFTPSDMLHVVMLAEFQSGVSKYLHSDTYHDQFVALPKAESVPFWQGSGTDFNFSSTSDIHITTANGNEVNANGILCVMFDRDALGVCNMNRRTTTNYNAKAEFTNYFYKMDAGYFNDLNENFVVFYIA
jgi:hypothetical protein